MAFATRTLTQIRDAILRDLRIAIDGAVTAEGSDYWAMATTVANALLPLYANGEWSAAQGLPDTADETGLTRWGRITGVGKRDAQYAAGTAVVESTIVTALPDGSTATNLATGATYKTVGLTSISGASPTGTAYLVAQEQGAGSDAEAGTILTLDAPPPGVDPQITVVSISGGDDAWDNARWALEIIKTLQQRPAAGNIAHVQALATSIPGVEEAFVYPALRGAGTLDVVVTTPASTGSRVAGTALLARVMGALQIGATVPNGEFLAGLAEDVFRNSNVNAAVEESKDLVVQFSPSAANAFAAWPPYGTGYVVPSTIATWYRIAAGPTSRTSFAITKPLSGTVVAPTVGDTIGVFFPSRGFCRSTIRSVTDVGLYWSIKADEWATSSDTDGDVPTETTVPVAGSIVPWCAQLPLIAGAPASDDTLALSGAVPEYFAGLGPGEMTPLTIDDITRRRRWPRIGDVSPISGESLWPTDLTGRLLSAILRGTDANNAVVEVLSGGASTPTVPGAGFIGTPPRVLTLGTIHVVPVT